ncbi:rNA polymerase sigma factor [Firmicutes bacterium CAG:582]|nr:rNA polymerase sigma factor [Firmicutes bacterium CAG:582]
MLKSIINRILRFLKRADSCLFVGSTDILPPPLSKEEEYELALRSSEGDKVARDKLIEHNLRLVVFLAKKYENTGYDIEDLVSIGSIGLIKGINTYKVDKNIKLATYVSRCISNEILMFLRKNKKKKVEVSLEETLNYDAEGNTLALEDVLGTDEDIVLENVSKKQDAKYLASELNMLNDREKLIMTLRYGLNNTKEYTQKEVATMLGISQSYISRIEKKVIRRIKETIN